ncbi:hypothetical protein KL928_000140 [Ogataea angusta]|uniref:Uncharacterized protein n=1 Tax=Pichia angusta TaxID=870730 RepID=A0AAN6DJ04_PICAN|nr:uncharacterized protein KL928_000140 [Ogataea angusta]KAG7821665.1 hypothetical protein KL928_000140 [Ogataea angusta]
MIVVWSEEPEQIRQFISGEELIETEDNFYEVLRFLSRHHLGFGKYNKNDPKAYQVVVKLLWEDNKLNTTHQKVFQDYEDNSRQCGLIYAIKMPYRWALVWVKIHNSKYVEIHQIDSKPREIGRLKETQLDEIKRNICLMLSLENTDDLASSFRYWMPVMEDENLSNEALLIVNLKQILEAYHWHGYGLRCENIKFNYHKLVTGFSDFRRAFHTHLVEGSPEPQEVMEVHEETPEPAKRPPTEDLPLRKRTRRGGEEEQTPKPKEVKEKVVDTVIHENQPCYVTVENLEQIKHEIKYDPKKLKQMVKDFQTKYEEIQAKFYSRWARQSGSNDVDEEDESSFSMYGPTQAEYEILISQEVVATKTLLKKLSHMDIFPNQQQMRAISNARRWINQRFKYDPATKTVQYLRDSNVVIPDYLDIPYIVIATHLHFDCLPPLLTYNHVRRNWYISKKTVDYIIAQCEYCNH